jgi:transposase
MAYREVTMLEIKEVLRQWLAGVPIKEIARRLGVDRKTVRRYLAAARQQGLAQDQPLEVLTDEWLGELVLRLHSVPTRPHGESWARCVTRREFIAVHLGRGLRLTKICKLLRRDGVAIPYPTLHRFAVAELGFGRRAPTVPVADCGPGEEVQADTGWMGYLEPDLWGKRRRFRAWIFTAVRSRHRFVWPCFQETTASAIEACEEAWRFYGGVFKVLIPDNTKAIVCGADALESKLTPTFLEYAQARGFHVDPTRVRAAQDKGRVERAVPSTRDDCFAGERLVDLEAARDCAHRWCLEEYGRRRHSRTQRLPLEHFEAEEKAQLLPAPTTPYEVPLWGIAKVGRDQLAQVAKALYSLPTDWCGHRLATRADHATVRFYARGVLVKTHLRQPPGGRAIDAADFPPHKTVYALRNVTFLQQQAANHGEAIGRFAQLLLDGPLPWTRMRRVYALLGLVRRYGAVRVEDTCRTALEHQMHDVKRLSRMLATAAAPPVATPTAPKVVPLARYLRPPSQYALPLHHHSPTTEDGGDR